MRILNSFSKKLCLLVCLLSFLVLANCAKAAAAELPLYELYRTENIYTFLKLNTKTGQITKLQYSMGKVDSLEVTVNDLVLADSATSEAGRFKLYPTFNIHTFLLLDTVSGRVWQIQWTNNADKVQGIVCEIK